MAIKTFSSRSIISVRGNPVVDIDCTGLRLHYAPTGYSGWIHNSKINKLQERKFSQILEEIKSRYHIARHYFVDIRSASNGNWKALRNFGGDGASNEHVRFNAAVAESLSPDRSWLQNLR